MKVRLALLYVLSAFFAFVIIVLAILNLKKTEEAVKENEEEEINFESNHTIQLYRSEKGQIEEIDLNTYLFCVVASEMPFKYEYEAIKAQAVVARTYLFNKILNNVEEQGDVCDDYRHCQAFNEVDKLEEIWKNKGFSIAQIQEGEKKIRKAILETENQIITYNGQIINALFHASSPQRTEDAKAIWSCEDIPYLKSVENVEDLDYENRESEEIIPYSVFKEALISKGYIDDLTLEDFCNICISEYTDSGRVKSISVGAYKISAEDLRVIFNLKSTNFKLNVDESNITFDVLGYGHGVGMSQVGANTYARQGKTYDEIIHHYYTDVDIVDGFKLQMKRGEL